MYILGRSGVVERERVREATLSEGREDCDEFEEVELRRERARVA